MMWRAPCTWCIQEWSLQSGVDCAIKLLSYFAENERVTLEGGFSVFTERSNVGLPLFTLKATGSRRYVPSCLLPVEESARNRRREIPEFVFLGATCSELLLKYFVMTSFQVSTGRYLKEELGDWLLEILIAVNTCQLRSRRAICGRTFDSMGAYARYALQKATARVCKVTVLPWSIISWNSYFVERVMSLVLNFDDLIWLVKYLRAICVSISCVLLFFFLAAGFPVSLW